METKGDLQGLYEEHLAWLQPNKDIECAFFLSSNFSPILVLDTDFELTIYWFSDLPRDNSAQVLALKEKLGQIREKYVLPLLSVSRMKKWSANLKSSCLHQEVSQMRKCKFWVTNNGNHEMCGRQLKQHGLY